MILNWLQNRAARVILCSALAIGSVAVTGVAAAEPMTVCAQESNDSGTPRMLEAQFEDAEGFRLFKYRTLRALNKLRDMGLTPQAIMQTLRGLDTSQSGEDRVSDGVDAATADASSAIGDAADSVSEQVGAYVGDVAQDVAGAVQEQTQVIARDAADAAREQMNGWAESIGESIGNALRDAIDQVLGTGSSDS